MADSIGEARLRFRHLVIAAACVVFTGAAAPAHAEKRVAFVVGNADYREAGVPALATPLDDARAMRDALRSLGFGVIYGEDLDQKGMLRAIGRFADRVGDADAAIVYFAGHGATFGDTPYLVPVDAEFSSLAAVPYELVPLETLIGELRRARHVRIVILDASRDDDKEQELKQREWRGGPVTRGLAAVKNPAGLIVAYAAQRLTTAADDPASGTEGSPRRHSVFTGALLNDLPTPGLDVKEMLADVGRKVEVATSGRQRPEISVSMPTRYVLAPAAVRPVEAAPPGAASEAAEVWATVQNTTSLMVLDEFIRQFDDVPAYAALARARRQELARTAAREPSREPLREQPSGPQQAAVAVDPMRPVQERGSSLQDCDACPQMVVVPAGTFTMGSPAEEKDRRSDEGPPHAVTIARPFAVARYHVTREQYAAFVNETGYQASTSCFKWNGGRGGSWRDPGFAQDGSHPVVCVSFEDANAYANWLSRKTGRHYRLPSEAEWEYAARGRTLTGAYPRFFFGDDEKFICRYANSGTQKCSDGHEYTSPVRQFPPNAFGLFDMAGNAWQWTADCYHDSYQGAPADGSAWTAGGCSGGHVVRGGSWSSDGVNLRAAYRSRNTDVLYNIGFRIARTLAP